MNIADALDATPVSSLDLTRHVTVPVTATVSSTVEAMCAAGRSVACVLEDEAPIGIFTQRDVLLRVVGRPTTWDRPIVEEMTRTVQTMPNTGSVADGLAIMNDWWIRSVPVLDSDGRLAGVLSYYVIMQTISNLLASRLGGTAPEAGVEHGLEFVDFTGLNLATPIIVRATDPVEVAAHHMRVRGIGSVLVVDERDDLVGVLTEFDLLVRIGCEKADLSRLTVGEIMTPDPVALRARSSIADAIQEMARHGISRIPLLGESGRPVGVAGFGDIAAYVEQSLDALG